MEEDAPPRVVDVPLFGGGAGAGCSSLKNVDFI
jgi:hypothetical protein